MLSSLGIGSGLDSNKLVDQLVTAKQRPPAQRLDREQAGLEAELSAFGQIKSRVGKLDEALSAMEGLADSRRTSVSDTSILTADASEGADTGQYRIEVTGLAQSQSLASGAFADLDTEVGTGTLAISVGGASAVNVDIEAGSATVTDIRDAINEADAGVTAAVLDDGSGQRLVLSANDTGAANTIDVSVTDDDGNNTDGAGLSALAYNGGAQNLSEVEAATDAQMTVNGVAVTRASNQVDDLLSDVTLDLQRAEAGTTVDLAVEKDTDAARKALQGFVDAYNGVSQLVDSATRFNAESGSAGVLLGDSTARGLMSSLRSGLVADAGVDGSLDQLVDLGVTTGESGELEIDSQALDKALEEDFAGVSDLLAGVAETFAGTVSRYGGDDGLLTARTDGVDARLEDVSNEREQLSDRIAQYEQRMREQFASLDTTVAKLQSTGDYLSRQLATLPTPGA